MATYTITVTDRQDAIVRENAASEGYADAQTFAQAKFVEVLITSIVKAADAKVRASVAAAMDDPVKAAAIKAAAGL